jgi:hypothetical protein
MRTHAFVAAGLFLLLCLPASGQDTTDKQSDNQPKASGSDEPVAIVEIGAATSWNVRGGAATFAPNLAAETTPIPNWLELEAGVSPFYTRKSTEWDTDLLFKKPWDLSRKSEFMLGVGPEWVHLSTKGNTSNSIAAELAGDFMFWPSGRHHFGWFLEPAYDYSFAGGHEQSIGMSAGLLIGIR